MTDQSGCNALPVEQWREQITNNHAWHEDKYIKMNFNPDLQDILKCTICRGYLSVGPFFYKKKKSLPHRMPTKVTCGRCFSESASGVRKKGRGMVQDELYEKLLPHLLFDCSYNFCEEKLLSHQVEEHENNCPYEWQLQKENSCKVCKNMQNKRYKDIHDYVTIPNVSELREKLSCDMCSKPLSVFPVVANANDGQIVCGRCATSSRSDDWREQKIFAAMAKFVKFPCANWSCTKLLAISEVRTHERTCRWAEVKCPLLCGKVGRVFEMSLHIRGEHLHQATVHLEVKPQNVLYMSGSEPYIVSVQAIEECQQQLSCAVYGLDEKQYGQLQVDFVMEDIESRVASLAIQVRRFKQKLESMDGVPFKDTRKKKKKKKTSDQLVDVEQAGVALDEDQSDHLVCKVCYHYMTGTIFLCKNKHRICGTCKTQLFRLKCPVCRVPLTNERDRQLEIKLARTVFPCQYRESKDCTVALLPKLLHEHEARCKRQDADLHYVECSFAECKIKLGSTHNEDFFNHCAEHHSSSVVHQGNTETIEWSAENDYEKNGHCKVLFFDGEVFLITYRFNVGANFGEAQGLDFCVTQKNASPKQYKYTLELVDINGLTVEREGTCNVALSKSGVNVKVELEVVEGMMIKDAAYCRQNNGLLAYRVKLKQNKTKSPGTVDPHDDDADYDDSVSDDDSYSDDVSDSDDNRDFDAQQFRIVIPEHALRGVPYVFSWV